MIMIPSLLVTLATFTPMQSLVARTPHRVVVEMPTDVPVLPFENIGPVEPLPSYTQGMSDKLFEVWAKQQNDMARQHVARRADQWNRRNPVTHTYAQDGSLTFGRTEYHTQNVQRTYGSHVPWGGGPLTLINPYVRPK